MSVHARSLSTAPRVAAWEGPSRAAGSVVEHAVFACQQRHPPARTKHELNCYGQRCRAMNERSKASSRVGSGPRRLPCERFWPNEPERVLAGHARHLGSLLAFWLKIPCIFPVVYREAYFSTRCSCMNSPGAKSVIGARHASPLCSHVPRSRGATHASPLQISSVGRVRYWTLMPASRMTLPHLTISVLRRAAHSAGVLTTGS